ncbi:hypothetical protein NMH_0573 [Neisseria meningitidis H44/76]|uniref:Uncharacterized protein n=1 Tax=Neisseria meningitidis serogroup B / serotype 15 (strain H44/76) TaxID=909420 RepID=E6MUX8_NEIMH|nr:hypothetical protein NMH_0573 [Neisseria meningitidis H44/76]
MYLSNMMELCEIKVIFDVRIITQKGRLNHFRRPLAYRF